MQTCIIIDIKMHIHDQNLVSQELERINSMANYMPYHLLSVFQISQLTLLLNQQLGLSDNISVILEKQT